MSEEFYTRPILRVRDVDASIAYYCDQLGFTRGWRHGDDKTLVAQVERNGFHVILDSGSVLPKPSGTSVLSLSPHQDDGIPALHRELSERGAKVLNAPFPVVWQENTLQFEVEDLDGNRLVFWGDAPK